MNRASFEYDLKWKDNERQEHSNVFLESSHKFQSFENLS